MHQQPVNVTAAGAEDKIILNVATAERTDIYDFEFLASAAVTLTLKDEAGTIFGVYALTANQLRCQGVPMGSGAPRFRAKGDLILGCSGAATITGHLGASATT